MEITSLVLQAKKLRRSMQKQQLKKQPIEQAKSPIPNQAVRETL
jgi:hypothetical protein